MATATKNTQQAIENVEYVRRLLGQKQPAFAASLELAAARLERQLREPGMAPRNRRHCRSLAAAAVVAGLGPDLFSVASCEEHPRQHQERQTGTDLQYRDDAAALPDRQPQTGHYVATDVRE